jgi:hypothetical protein
MAAIYLLYLFKSKPESCTRNTSTFISKTARSTVNEIVTDEFALEDWSKVLERSNMPEHLSKSAWRRTRLNRSGDRQLAPHRLMFRLEIQVHSRRDSSNSAILLSTSGSKGWISMVMAVGIWSHACGKHRRKLLTPIGAKAQLTIANSSLPFRCYCQY